MGLLRLARQKPFHTLAIALVLLKIVQLVVDSTPLFYYDSAAFVDNAFISVNAGRSKIYGLLIRYFAVPFGSFTPLVVVQVLMGAAAAWLLAAALHRYLGVRMWIAFAAAFAFALDPAQIAGEHMVMAECFTMVAVAGFLVSSLAYLQNRNPRLLAAMAVLGVLAISLRVIYLPLVIACAVLVPVVAYFTSPERRPRALATALALSILFTFVTHFSYRQMMAHWSRGEPTYLFLGNFWLVARVAPILKVEDAADAKSAECIRRVLAVTSPQAGLQYESYQDFQLWEPEGIVKRLRAAYSPDLLAADHAADHISHHAMLRDPAGFAGLFMWTLKGFWKTCLDPKSQLAANDGMSDSPMLPKDATAMMIRRVGPIADDTYKRLTPTRWYHTSTGYWCLVQLLSPLFGLLAFLVTPRRYKWAAALFALWPLALLVFNIAGSATASLRYLHPLSFTAIAAIAMLFEAAWLRLRVPSRSAPSAAPETVSQMAD